MKRTVILMAVSLLVALVLLVQQGCGRPGEGAGLATIEETAVATVGEGPYPPAGGSSERSQESPSGVTSRASSDTAPVSSGDPGFAAAGSNSSAGFGHETATAGPSTSTSAAPGEWEAPGADVAAAFVGLAEGVEGLTIYSPREMPAGTVLAASWWPVSGGHAPDPVAAPGRPNPRVVGEGAEAEVRVLLQVDGGWVEVLEGVHGDLGELPSEAVGEVAGHAARSYRLMGGHLVQWSDAGRWYAVFGLDLASGVVERIAAGMEVQPR